MGSSLPEKSLDKNGMAATHVKVKTNDQVKNSFPQAFLKALQNRSSVRIRHGRGNCSSSWAKRKPASTPFRSNN